MFRRFSPLCLLHLLLLLLAVAAQDVITVTSEDDNGDTVVLRITDDVDGDPVATRVLTTLTSATTTTMQGQGPIVGAPATNTGVATIVFVYSTDGAVYTATFTPSYQSPTPAPTLGSGTIISPADWTYTKPVTVSSAEEELRRLPLLARTYGGIFAAIVVCMVVGARVVL